MDQRMTRRRFLDAGVSLSAVALLGGCYHYRGYGPPPHAPAHGYRRRHHDRWLVYDAGLGLYVVSGYPGLYFHDGHYYRRHGDHWDHAPRIGGPWQATRRRRLPPGLAKKRRR